MTNSTREPKGFSRRSFLKGTALATAVGATGLALAGCSQQSPTSSSIPAKWDKETDVLVIGTGCGLASAIKAAEAGSEVLIIDKSDHVGGFWLASGGGCTMGGGNVVQEKAGEADDVDTWFEDEMFSCEYRGDADVMRTLCERGAETVNWMEELGIKWGKLDSGMLRPPVKRGLWPVENPDVYVGGWGTGLNAGICWTQVWERKLEELGVPILLEHKMTKIFREEQGPVVGCEVETSDGTITIKARQVVVATGSWTDNDHMVKMYDPRAAGENCYGDGGCPGAGIMFNEETGDGHLAASAVGGILTDMSFVSYLWIWWGLKSFWSWGEEPLDWRDNKGWARGKTLGTDNFFGNGICVQSEGKRFFNENLGKSSALWGNLETNTDFGSDPSAQLRQLQASAGKGEHCENPEISEYTKAYLSLPQPRNVWAVCDAPMAAAIKWPVEEMANPNPLTGSLFDPECVAIADTIEELAKKTGLPVDELKATIETYNAYVDGGVDEEFGRTEMPAKIMTPPFYAGRASLIRHTGRNGLRVNSKSQVIDGTAMLDTKVVSVNEEPVIPHLYAAGECGNSLGYRRPHNSLGHYATAAMISGENVALEEPLK
ncbi:MAG: FAD-dependent oxidoreductase [Raoultibacter sp.]